MQTPEPNYEAIIEQMNSFHGLPTRVFIFILHKNSRFIAVRNK